MKNELNFWRSLEKYVWRVVEKSTLPRYWREIAIGLVLTVLLTSLKYAKYSAVGQTTTYDLITKAAQIGDYETAQRLYENCKVSQCPDIDEELVYPERKLEKRIAELENKLEQYPGNREVYLSLANLYDQLKDERAGEPRPYGEMAAEYREKARVLDPNGVEF